ncbi:MAG: DUF5615 family PIN-like protein [candidate division KSB1 bacterium]|nr:DUF5615 family PIN-like protein [candidate division KSB1 bacterium]
MKLKMIADVHISPITVAELRKAGYQISRVTELLSATASDIEIIEFAKRHESAIITQDLDFSAIIAQSGYDRPSVVSLRVGNAKPLTIANILLVILPQIEEDLAQGVIVSVDETEFRIRKLPIKSIG